MLHRDFYKVFLRLGKRGPQPKVKQTKESKCGFVLKILYTIIHKVFYSMESPLGL